MSAPGATPGPWNVQTDSHLLAKIGSSANGGIYVARVQGPDTPANANLIAASPALYDALATVMHEFFPHPTDEEYPELTAARAALALARGEAA